MADSKKNAGLPQPDAPLFPEWQAPGARDPKLTPAELEQIRAELEANPLPIGQVPGYGSSSITGRIAANGQINSGRGFTCNRFATGKYTITFDHPFDVEPIFLITLLEDPIQGGAVVFGITSRSTTAFTVEFKVSGAADQNQTWEFATILMRA